MGLKTGGRAQLVLRGHRVTQVRHTCRIRGPHETDWERHLLEVKGHWEVWGAFGEGLICPRGPWGRERI